MLASSHTMETVRQFLAAFAESDWDGLRTVLAVDVSARVQVQRTVKSYQTQTAVAQALLVERARWAQKRIDVQGWQTNLPLVVVRFIVQLLPTEPGDFQRYEATLSVRGGQVRRLELNGDVLAAPLPAWEAVQRRRSGLNRMM